MDLHMEQGRTEYDIGEKNPDAGDQTDALFPELKTLFCPCGGFFVKTAGRKYSLILEIR